LVLVEQEMEVFHIGDLIFFVLVQKHREHEGNVSEPQSCRKETDSEHIASGSTVGHQVLEMQKELQERHRCSGLMLAFQPG
jgi:hypothetical protein